LCKFVLAYTRASSDNAPLAGRIEAVVGLGPSPSPKFDTGKLNKLQMPILIRDPLSQIDVRSHILSI
jgi:hypothetical protein